MQCISPINIRDPADPNSKKYIAVPCGKCYACLSNRRTEWTYRLLQETKHASSAMFITLTYDDGCVPISDDTGELILQQRDVQLWLKRFRKLIEPHKIRYFYVGEYGGLFRRPHYHILLFNYPVLSRDLFSDLVDTWDKGYFKVGSVTQASIHYVAKYVIARMDRDKYEVSPFMRCSLRPAIGSQWLKDDMIEYVSRDYSVAVPMPGGYKCAMPQYYRRKIYNDDVKKEHVKQKNMSFAALLRAETDAKDDEYRQAFGAVDIGRMSYSSMVKNDMIRKGQQLLKDLNNETICFYPRSE